MRYIFPILALSFISCGDEGVPSIDLGYVPRPPLSYACVDGTTRSCTIHVSDTNCLIGVNTCVDGKWGSCQPKPKTKGATAQKCEDNPCNPNCREINQEPVDPISPQPQTGDGFTTTVTGWGVTPGGFQSKLDCGSTKDCRFSYPSKCGGEYHYSRYDACQSDHTCSSTTGRCRINKPFWTWSNATCSGIDLTIGAACELNGEYGFPLCNRGNLSVGKGADVNIQIIHGAWIDLSECAPPNSKAESCNITLEDDLSPGECIRVTEDQCPTWDSGNTVGYVNYDLAIQECGMSLTSPVMPEPPFGISSPGCMNNWADLKKGAACAPPPILYDTLIVTDKYVATCPPGYGVKWDLLTYESEAQGGSNIQINARTDNSGTLSPSIVLADIPFSHPESCLLSGPLPCPISLGDALDAYASVPTLEITFTLEPSSNRLVAPSVMSWQVTYDCYPNE